MHAQLDRRAHASEAPPSGPPLDVSAHRSEFHCTPQRRRSPGRSERSATAELSAPSTARTRRNRFSVQPRCRAQTSTHGNSQSGVARSESHADATSPPLSSPHSIARINPSEGSTRHGNGSKFSCTPQRRWRAARSERSAAAELSSNSTARTRPQPFGVQLRCCAQRPAHGNPRSGVATAASHADASRPLIQPALHHGRMKSSKRTTPLRNPRSGVATLASHAGASSPLVSLHMVRAAESRKSRGASTRRGCLESRVATSASRASSTRTSAVRTPFSPPLG